MNTIISILFLSVFYIVTASPLHGSEFITPLYITKITKSISQQLSKNQKYSLKEKTLCVQTSLKNATLSYKNIEVLRKVDESLLYWMSLEGFRVLDSSTLQNFTQKASKSALVLLSSVTEYKNGIVINARIVDRQTAVIVSVAQVNVSRKIMRKIQRVHKKDGWFEK